MDEKWENNGYDPYTGRPIKKGGTKYSSDPETQRLLKRSTSFVSADKNLKKRASKNIQKKIPSSSGVVIPRVDNNDYEVGKGNLRPNVLHKYASYNYLFTLSGINETELRTHGYLKSPPHDIIARSSGVSDPNLSTKQYVEQDVNSKTYDPEFAATRTTRENTYEENFGASRSILQQGLDVFFENVNMLSTTGPNAERNLGNFTKMEFEIHEPYGITLVEKIRAAAAINGYEDYQDAPLLLTIDFKGFDENGNPVPEGSSHVRKIPVLITRMEFDVDQAGAKYSIFAVPYGELAYDDRFKFPRTDIPVKADNYQDWIRIVQSTLDKNQIDEVKEGLREYPDRIRFHVHPDVAEQGKSYLNGVESTNFTADVAETEDLATAGGYGFIESPAPTVKKTAGSGGSGISLVKYFEDAIRAGSGYEKITEDFWTTYLKGTKEFTSDQLDDPAQVLDIFESNKIQETAMKHQYIHWYKIKTTVETDTKRFDRITKMHPKTVTYQAVPYRIHVMKFLRPGISLGKIDWNKKVHKRYDYIYTGDNLDVQGLKINYKSAYYMRNVRGDDNASTENNQILFEDKTKKVVDGKEKYPENPPLRSYPTGLKGNSSLKTGNESEKPQEFYDYLTNPEADMMRIELEILGDPAYICQDIYTPVHADRMTTSGGIRSWDSERDSFNADSFQPIIAVNYRLPDDINDQDGLMFSDGKKFREDNLFFNGLYQVNKIDSKFDNGQFTQTLHCSRFNNQQGEGLDPTVSAMSNSSKNKIIIDGKKKKAKDLAIEKSNEVINDIFNTSA